MISKTLSKKALDIEALDVVNHQVIRHLSVLHACATAQSSYSKICMHVFMI